MPTRKTGLHKDVSLIFKGVWNPQVDNIQPSFDEPEIYENPYIQPNPAVPEKLPHNARSINIVKVFKASGSIFSSRRRREKKRLLSISKHLMINQSS